MNRSWCSPGLKPDRPMVMIDQVCWNEMNVNDELFDGTLQIVEQGYDPGYMTIWDPISFWMGVEGALYGLIDRPG